MGHGVRGFAEDPRWRGSAELLSVMFVIGGAFGASARGAEAPPMGVCPPYKLRDERGETIDPVHGPNAKAPYSPRQTCGAKGCHDYEKITEGFHFTQGKGEAVPPAMAERYRWVSSPGNYGGNWCSPAPLYRQLARKENPGARVIDMTSFEFVTATCGNCHPGGGPLEFDRDGRRYDDRMRDPASGFSPGGDNRFDGDYFKARWSETGVIEADCLLCHLPEYDFKARNDQLAALNFKWAATAGARFGKVTGSVKAGEAPEVAYDLSRFDAEGFALVHSVPEPRNETCLSCHAKPDWKKRGASFSPRTDVHIAAGLRCVDCHAAGSRAADERIRGREVHQFGKGDCPSGWVRNDLDGTVRSCEDCHIRGWHNAPLATHEWLPPLHLEKLSCQACHIPFRAVKSALVQASDVFNPAPSIDPPGKRIWTFYDQRMRFWNHYGELTVFTARDQPTDITRPTWVRYKGKIYPANRVHSTWVGFEEKGKPGLDMLFMRDYFTMWREHRQDPKSNWPELARIADDNGDGVPEINRPEEIDAVIAATRAYLTKTGFPLEDRRLVWVMDDRAWYASGESRPLPHEPHEATPYASVYKFSHDVAPARAALGARGCAECHGRRSDPLFHPVLAVPFAEADGKPVWMPNYRLLDLSASSVALGAFREEALKPAIFVLSALVALLAVLCALRAYAVHRGIAPSAAWGLSWAALAACIVAAILAARSHGLIEYMTLRRFTLDANHTALALGIGILGVVVASQGMGSSARRITPAPLAWALWALLVFTAACGAAMLAKGEAIEALARPAYTGFDLGLALIALLSAISLLLRLARRPGEREADRARGPVGASGAGPAPT